MTIIPILSNELLRPQTLTVPESGYVWSGLPVNIDHRPSTGYWTFPVLRRQESGRRIRWCRPEFERC
ncbi:hypothetical protein TWF594_007561 [Orbilia oligospora]|nr:hypothetical protein TWF594_007561 [Orbilia oligospora]